jgi:hypothetical protein
MNALDLVMAVAVAFIASVGIGALLARWPR